MDWQEVAQKLDNSLRLKSHPVGLKLLGRAGMLDGILRLRRSEHRLTFCQMLTLARLHKWTMGARASELYPMCSGFIGLRSVPEDIRNGNFQFTAGVYRTLEDSKLSQDCRWAIPPDFEAVAVAPLAAGKFDPDLVVVVANPGQMFRLLTGIQWQGFEQMQFAFSGEGSSCSDSIARCYLTGKPSLALPTLSESRYAHFHDDELIMTLPSSQVGKILTGLEKTQDAGIRYPFPPYGAQVDVMRAFVPDCQPILKKILDEEG